MNANDYLHDCTADLLDATSNLEEELCCDPELHAVPAAYGRLKAAYERWLDAWDEAAG